MTEINIVQIARKPKYIPEKSRSEFFNKPWGVPLPGVSEPSGDSPLLALALLEPLLPPSVPNSDNCDRPVLALADSSVQTATHKSSFPFLQTTRISFRVISQECLTCAQYIPPSSAPWSVYDEATVRRQANVDLSRAAPAPLCSLVRFLYNRCTVYDTRTLIELCFVLCRHRCEVSVTALLFGLCLTLSPSSPPLLWMLPMSFLSPFF